MEKNTRQIFFKSIVPNLCMFPVPTQAPNRDRENARPPHCSCIAYLHDAPAVWQRPQMGLFSSHFCRRALHLVQPVKDLDMGAALRVTVVVVEVLRARKKFCGEG